MKRLPAVLSALIWLLSAAPAPAQLGTLMGVGGPVSSSCAYTTEACALFAQMTSAPDSTRKGLINTAIACLKANGAWAKEDWLVVMAAGNSHDGLLNWVNPSKTLSTVGSVTFTTDRGFNLASAVNTNYMQMPEVLNAAGNNYALNNAHFSTYINVWAFANFGGVVNSGATGGAANYNSSIGQYDSTKAFFGQINISSGTPGITTGVDATAANYIGMWAVTRSASNAQAIYKSGTSVNGANSWTSSAVSVLVPTTAPRLLWGDGVVAWAPPSATTRLAIYSTGTSFANSTEAGNESTCLTTYLTAIGAA